MLWYCIDCCTNNLRVYEQKVLESTDRFLLIPLSVVLFVEAWTFRCLTLSGFGSCAKTSTVVGLCPQVRSIFLFRSLLDVSVVDVVMYWLITFDNILTDACAEYRELFITTTLLFDRSA